jgi:hypothetical protein
MTLSNQPLEDWWPNEFLAAIIEKYGDNVEAVILYGSWLRGKRDTLPDFYVIFTDYDQLPSLWQKVANQLLEPNVYQLGLSKRNVQCSAKYATISLKHLEKKTTTGFHPYLWARFSQPCSILYVKNEKVQNTLNILIGSSEKRMMREALGMSPKSFTSTQLWETALTLTYGAELRAESQDKITLIVNHHQDYFESKVTQHSDTLGLSGAGNNEWTFECSNKYRLKTKLRWKARRILGIFLSIARLLKATSTFNQPLEYLLWKIERHTGIKENATALQLKYPLIFSWPLIWKIFRRGGFK